MTINLAKLKALAEAAKRDPYDHLAANDYGMSIPPATALDLIAEIERHRQANAEGCKPDSSTLLSDLPCAAATCRSLDKAEGCKPDLNIAHLDYNQTLAEIAAHYLLKEAPVNYVGKVFTITVKDHEQTFEIVVTTQRIGAKTAHELREIAESEVERLRELAEKGERLGALLPAIKQANGTLRTKLAEREAQLDSALDDIEGLIGTVRYYNKGHQLHNEEGSLLKYRAALSARAEQSIDLCAEGTHEFVPFQDTCVKCNEPYQAVTEAKTTSAALMQAMENLAVKALASNHPPFFPPASVRQAPLVMLGGVCLRVTYSGLKWYHDQLIDDRWEPLSVDEFEALLTTALHGSTQGRRA